MVNDPTPIEKFERGVDLAKYPQILAPMAAVAAPVYSLSTGTLLGLIFAVGCFAYAMVWIFANASGAAVIFLRNLVEIRQLPDRLSLHPGRLPVARYPTAEPEVP
jgi:hypothetical protein